MPTFAELRTEVLAHQFSAQRYSTLVDGWLNEGYRRVARKAKLRTRMDAEDFVTVAGTDSYALPTDFSRFESLGNTDTASPLKPLTLREYDDLEADSGIPVYYSIIGELLYLYPTPGGESNLRLRYWSVPGVMTDPAESPDFPEDYHGILVDYAVYKAFSAEHDFEAAQYHKGLFDAELLELRTALTEDTREDPQQIQGMYGYED